MISYFNDARMSSKRCLTNQKVPCSEVLEDDLRYTALYCELHRYYTAFHSKLLRPDQTIFSGDLAFYISTKFGKSVISWRNHDVADSSKRLMVSSILVVCFFVPHQPALLRIKISHLQRYIHLKEVNVPLAEIT